MKEIIPLKKDIIFKTMISEVTSINLDYNYKLNNDLIEGFVFLNGSYKMTEASVIEEDFSYKIPFSIALTKKINKDSIKIEIDDFKYDFLKDIMKVNIDLELTCDEEDSKEEIIEEESMFNEFNNLKDFEIKNELDSNNIKNDFNEIATSFVAEENKYYTYKVYIVREEDNVDVICKKYNISLDELKKYNDITNLSIGSKVIIPCINV